MLLKKLLFLVLAASIAGCSTGRFAGFNNCSADHSTVWWEYPNSSGSYDGLGNNAQNCVH